MNKWKSFGKSRRLWVAAAAAIVAAAIVALGVSGESSDSAAALGRAAPANPTAYEAACPPGAPIPVRSYDLGTSFAGLDLASRKALCIPPPPAGIPVAGGPNEAIGYASVVYGSCAPNSDGSCYPPLNVQSWPECARNPDTYEVSSSPAEGRHGGLTLASEPLRIPAAPWIPAREFEGGMRLEIYSGETTIVVFSTNPRLARAAASALAGEAANQAPSSSAAELRTLARAPGDASTCHHRLPQEKR